MNFSCGVLAWTRVVMTKLNMYQVIEKAKDRKSCVNNNESAQRIGKRSTGTYQLIDNRPDTIAQFKLVNAISENPFNNQVSQFGQDREPGNEVAQRSTVDNVPGIGTIDTTDYTEDELDLFFHHSFDQKKYDQSIAVNDAIGDGEVKPDLEDPGRIRGISSSKMIEFMPVNLFQLDDRIPPRVNMPYNIGVLINRKKIGDTVVTLCILGNGGANGLASVQGNDKVDITRSSSVMVRGLAQTAPGNARSLSFAAMVGDIVAKRSYPFSVAAAPVNWRIYGKEDLVNEYFDEFDGNFYGMTVKEEWQSDSGDTNDLDQVQVDEVVEIKKQSGVYADIPLGVRGPTEGTLQYEQLDDHAIEESFISGAGTKEIHQVHVYKDARTGGGWKPIENSGYIISQKIKVVGRERGKVLYEITTQKYGAGVTANGVASKAGSGNKQNKLQVLK